MENFRQLTDLAGERLGGKALAANDEFFAAKENLLKPGRGLFIAGKYTSRGKWMDGWETRRRREPGHDWCVIRLGLRGVIRGIVVDTDHFIGNHPESFSLDACDAAGAKISDLTKKGSSWAELLPPRALLGGSENLFEIQDNRPWTHARLNIFPDGGVARLRLHGAVVPDLRSRESRELDLAAVENGGLVLGASDMLFGVKDNLILPGRSLNMGDGWETRRRRGPGHDWCIVRLGAAGLIGKIEVHTTHFKGNYPESFRLEACLADRDAPLETLESAQTSWWEIVPRTKLGPDRCHRFPVSKPKPASHARLSIFPDGGVARLRLYGRLAKT